MTRRRRSTRIEGFANAKYVTLTVGLAAIILLVILIGQWLVVMYEESWSGDQIIGRWKRLVPRKDSGIAVIEFSIDGVLRIWEDTTDINRKPTKVLRYTREGSVLTIIDSDNRTELRMKYDGHGTMGIEFSPNIEWFTRLAE